MTASNDDAIEQEVKSRSYERENVRKEELEEFESVEPLVDLREQHCPEKYEDEAFCHQDHVEENWVSRGYVHWRLGETHYQEVDKREAQSPVRQKGLV